MAKRSFLLFLYSTPNIVGCIWGLIALIAFFAIKINLWLYLVPGLYIGGYLISPKTKALHTEKILTQQISGRELQNLLELLIKKISNQVAQPVLDKVIHIKENILMLLPRLNEMSSTDYDFHLVKQTVTDYLPQMLGTYLELPPLFAKMHKMRNGKTSQELLIEQLELLDEQIEKILISVNSKDADALIAHGEFLKGKFAGAEDWI